MRKDRVARASIPCWLARRHPGEDIRELAFVEKDIQGLRGK